MARKRIFGFSLALLLLLCVTAFVAVPKGATTAEAHDIPASEFDPSEFSELTYGIYWYTADSDVPVAAKDATNFDPTKPTLIYAHGMKYAHEGLKCREGLSLKDNNKEYMNQEGFDDYAYEEEFYKPLIQQGYNVGVFFWNQLADCLFTGEYKFWVTTVKSPNGRLGMSYGYVKEDGSYDVTKWNDDSNPEVTVTYLYRDCIVEALGKNFTGRLHLTGHSMGGQLTLAVSQALCYSYDRGEISSRYLPDRVTILDPYLGSVECTGVVDTTGEEIENKRAARLAAEAAKTVADHDIPIEGYGANREMVYRYFASPASMLSGSYISEEECAEIIKLYADNITWVYLEAMMDTYHAFIPTHTMAVDYYFSTIYMDPKYDPAGVEVPSFKASDDHIRALRGKSFRQDYDTTLDDPNPMYQSDSSFVRVDGESQEVIEATALPQALTGTLTETEKEYTVRLSKNGETVAETTAYKGKYFFNDVDEGEYELVVLKGEKKVASVENVSVSETEEITVLEPIKTKTKSSSAASTKQEINWTLVGGIAGGVFVLILLIVIIKKKRA